MNFLLKYFGIEIVNHNKGIEILREIDGDYFNVRINYFQNEDNCRLLIKKKGIHSHQHLRVSNLLILESKLNKYIKDSKEEDIEDLVRELRLLAHNEK